MQIEEIKELADVANIKCVIFGIGTNLCRYLEYLEEYNIVALVDNDKGK